MTDTEFMSYLRKTAVYVLMEETYSHVTNIIEEGYKTIGIKNARLLGVPITQFMYKGEIYPPNQKVTSQIPILHYSLLGELETTKALLVQADFHYVKNFFIAVVSASHNEMVLNELLPPVLINALTAHFEKNSANYDWFKYLDKGVFGTLQQEPISVTETRIQNIKTHFKDVIVTVRRILMDRMLLQK